MDIIELFINEEDEVSGIEAISVVENPAIEEDFIALKNQEFKLAEIDKEKRILMGAALIPNKPIYRQSGDKEYYIYFSKDTVAKASQLYLKNGFQNQTTLEHQHKLHGLTLVESWIVEDEKYDKSRKYGLNVPVGTWMGAVKVNNQDVWDEYVKNGKVKMPSDDTNIDYYRWAQFILAEKGFDQYEISNWNKPGKECQHNLHYWEIDPYLSFGPSAHSFDGEKRYSNMRNLNQYIQSIEKGDDSRDFIEEVSEKNYTNH